MKTIITVLLVALALGVTACSGRDAPSQNLPSSDSPFSKMQLAKFPKSDASLMGKNVFVFSKTAGWRHDSIEAGQSMFRELAGEYSFEVAFSEEANMFTDKRLAPFDVIVFLNTTGDVLNDPQQRAMERFIQSGGGFVGIHAATDTEAKGWPWFVKLVGASFDGHPGDPSNVQMARMTVKSTDHLSTKFIPQKFKFLDEWYDFRAFNRSVNPLVMIDRDSYSGAKTTGLEPISWFHDYDGGRSFYTNLGHKIGTYSDLTFQNHVLGGLAYAAGTSQRDNSLNYRPDPDRFKAVDLTGPLSEPVSMDIRADGSVWIVERKGGIKRWSETDGVESFGLLEDVYSPEGLEFGLIGVASYPLKKSPQGLFLMYNVKAEEQVLQRLSYLPLNDDVLDQDNRLNYLDIPMDETCCHTGGAIRFGPDGHLYLAIGDNSNPFELSGFSPRSEDDTVRDARRSSGNTKDLRGKILRISPSLDGTYTIPDGNLFEDPDEGRPEIYVMGTRNPYTIGFDTVTGHLYYGDVGPDAHADAERGSRGYDEINRVTEAGNFGWPFFVGDNSPYRKLEPETGELGKLYNPQRPVNSSPRNTGANVLPPAQPALVWYPYTLSEKFPALGQGGRNALSGGVYRRPKNAGATVAWPDYFEGKLIIGDFIRRQLNIVTIDQAGRAERVETVAESAPLNSPLDLGFGPDGALYVLNYGSAWYSANNDSGLIRLEYQGAGNRLPNVVLNSDKVAGGLPLNVSVSSEGTMDPEGDDLVIDWQVVPIERGAELTNLDELFSAPQAVGQTANLAITMAGAHAIIARVKDEDGAYAYAAQEIEAGNEPPKVTIKFNGNQSFYWPERGMVDYQIISEDPEDGSSLADEFLKERITARSRSFALTEPIDDVIGHLENPPLNAAALLSENNCTTCHQIDAESVGPSYMDVAFHYSERDDASAYLNSVLENGGAGVWGDHQMPAHDYLDENVRSIMVDYVLGLFDGSSPLPVEGQIDFASIASELQLLEMKASYVDEGTLEAPSLEATTSVVLTPNELHLEVYTPNQGALDGVNKVWADQGRKGLGLKANGSFVNLGRFDLTDITSVVANTLDGRQHMNGDVELQIRLGSAEGDVFATSVFPLQSNAEDKWQLTPNTLERTRPMEGFHDLYLVANSVGGADHVGIFSLIFEFE